MIKIQDDVTITIEECGALAEVLIPAFELNDIRRERDEYLMNTVSDLYDRVVYMVRSNGLEYDPTIDENGSGDGPELTLEVRIDNCISSSTFWAETRRERQDLLKARINEVFARALVLQRNIQEELKAQPD